MGAASLYRENCQATCYDSEPSRLSDSRAIICDAQLGAANWLPFRLELFNHLPRLTNYSSILGVRPRLCAFAVGCVV
jgi:hypothetical protein